MSDKITANEMAKMIDDCQARAEAAENDLRELRENTLLALGLNPIDVTDGMEDVTIAYLLGGWKERIAELEAENADLRGLPMSAHTRKLGALHRENEELRQHIAALEAQIAAQAWRPVTEEEPPQGKKVLGKQYIESSPCIVSLEFDPMENDFVWQDVDGVSYFYDSINYWRSIE